jgi:Putative metal-binding motif/Secretion system C-terminal sorting domain
MTKSVFNLACIALSTILLSVTAGAQQMQQLQQASNEPVWQEMMKDPSKSFFETQAKFNEYWSNRPMEKGKGFKAFKRWEWIMAPRVNQVTGEYPPVDALWQAYQQQPEMFGANENMPGDWTYIGNASVPANGGGAGRINGVRAIPGSTTSWYVCAPGGGLWKTTNSGTSYSIVGTDFLSSIGASDVAIDPTNTNILYLATGDGDAGDTYALGVLKSTDAGATWNTTGLNWTVTQTRTCSRIIIHPTVTQTLICATSDGIYKTTNGGTSWSQVLAGSYKEVKFKPGDPSVIYAVSDQFFRSTDTGTTWTQITSGLPDAATSQRMAVAVTAANANYVYILASGNSSGFLGLYRSTDGGTTFTTRATTPNLLGWSTTGGDTGGQGWYDLTIESDPTNAEIIWTGGVNVWKSINGGTNFTLNGHWYGGGGAPYVHADNHHLYAVPGSSPTRILVGNDGGVFSTTNGGTNWSDLSSNLAIAQQYKLGLAALNANLVITGWQDNGTNLRNGAANSQVMGGDGMESAIDHTNSNIMYAEVYYGQIGKSTNGGGSFSNIVGSGGANEDEDGAWVTPYVLGNNPNHFFVGKSRVYKSVDGGVVFTASAAFGGTADCSDLALAPSDNNYVYASKGGTLYRSTDNAATFVALTGLPGNAITDIAVHNTDPQKIWVTVSGYNAGLKVYTSSNAGATWTNVSGTLPNLPANAIVFQNGSSNGVYVGMDAGVFYRDDNTGAWVPYMNALPNVVITELEIHYATNTITAATYGRGTWRAPLFALPDLDASFAGFLSPNGNSCVTDVNPQLVVSNAGNNPITSFTISYFVTGQGTLTFPWTGTLTTGQTVTITLPTYNYGTGNFTLNATIININGGTDDNAGNNTGTASYQVINAPANDVCAGAITLTVNAAAITVDNSATCSDGPDPGCGGTGIKDLWYKFVYTGGNITVRTTLGSNADTRIAVFASCGGTNIGCNDDISGTNYASQLLFTCANLTVGQTYYIQAGGYGTSSGTFTIQVTSAVVNGCTNPLALNYNACATVDDGSCVFTCTGPANDICSTAISITAFGTAVASTNVGTCTEGPNPNCGGTLMKDVWYSFTYNGGTVRIETSGGTLTDTRLAVYTACGGTQIACDDDDGAGAYSLINFGCTTGNGAAGANEATLLVQGQTYYIQAGGFNSLTGTFNLTVTVTAVSGCTNPAACNYNPCASVNNGSCVLPVTYYQDIDGDAYGNTAVSQVSCSVPVGYTAASGDCNDNNAAINPGATEVCNGIDDDCDGSTDEGLLITFYRDFDNDSYGNASISLQACTAPAGYVANSTDCNDANSAVHPGATEFCNGIDDDCDGSTDEGVQLTFYRDFDSDGFGDLAITTQACSAPAGYVANSTDCNDANSAIYPGAAEVCNGVDDNCNGSTDEGVQLTFYRDQDGDGYGNLSITTQACSAPAGYVANSTDCNDANAAVRPGATEVCNGLDDDCDGSVDEGVQLTFYRDADGDGYGNLSITTQACSAPAGYVANSTDCNDSNAAVRPGATEVCNGIDDDCDGSTDEGVLTTYYRDIDNDAYGNTSVTVQACSAPAGYVATSGDCNDNNATVYPGAIELCDGLDNNCNTLIDDIDVDGDGFSACSGDCNDNNAAINPGATELCNGIDDDCDGTIDDGFDNDNDGYTTCEGDCNDSNPNIFPGAPEACNGIDDDCDALIDDNVTTQNYYTDADGDGYGATLIGNFCSPPANSSLNNLDCNDANASVNPNESEICNNIDDDCDGLTDEGFDIDGDGYTTCEGDCNDNNASIHPGASEACNGVDDNCDGTVDEGVQTMWYLNADGDNAAAGQVLSCTSPGVGWTTTAPTYSTDCNDSNAAIHPGAAELCNGVDDDCDGSVDEGVVFQNYYADADSDGFGSALLGNFCIAPANSSLNNTDCNDGNAAIRPGATEVCNGVDDDCDGSIDEGVLQTYYRDFDGDTYGNVLISITACSPIAGYVSNATDCNDNNAAIRPLATELCNGIDDDCDGTIDEGCGAGSGNNDTMAGAASITNSGNVYPSCSMLNGTCVGATPSPEGNPLNVITGEDRWFKFNALSPGVRVTVNTTAFDAVIELHNSAGAEINSENMTGFGGTEILNYAGLTEGQQYFVAVRNYNSAQGNGAFNVCVQALMDSRCDDGPGTYVLCANFKADWSGANAYSYNFTPTAGGTTTSAIAGGQISLANAGLALQYGAQYNSTIDAIFNLTDGAGNPETIVIIGSENCLINMGPHPDSQVKQSQRCPAVLLRSNVLQAKPFVCGAIQFEFEFTEIDLFNNPVGLPFTVLSSSSSSSIGLWFTSPQVLAPTARYSVRSKPIFAYGPGNFGTPQCIEISGVAMDVDPATFSYESEEKASLAIEMELYPNPNSGEMLNLNIASEYDGVAEVRIIDATGRLVFATNYAIENSLNTIITFNQPLPNGLYSLEVLMNGERVIQRMIVQK